jgi:glycosyltransferase involved in cell wall biosynthesis
MKMAMGDKTLILFTSSFPYGTGEIFIENEFDLLLKNFKKIIVVTNNTSGEKTHPVPDNLEIIRIPYKPSLRYKIKAVLNFFNPIIQGETQFIKSVLHQKISKSVLFTMLASYAKGLETSATIESLVFEQNISIDTLYLYSYWMNDTVSGLAIFKKIHPEVHSFCRAHGWDVYFERQTPPYLPLRPFMLNTLDRCYCVSENGKQYLQKMVADNAVDRIALSRLGSYNKSGLLSSESQNKLCVISCSNIIPLKRIHLIIEALALIKNFTVEWTHFGDGPLKEQIIALASKKLGGSSTVKYTFAGQYANHEILQYYSDHTVDCFINVSETEGLPVSIMEAISFGIPTIATNVGGVSEMVHDNINGFLLPANCTAEQIAQTLERLYTLSPDKKSTMRQQAFETWDKEFNAERNYAKFIEALNAL